MPEPRSLVVVGAGIGGLTAALALARKGFAVTVLERAGELHEVGAGIQISPNAARVLIGLGAGDAIAACAFQPEGVRLFSTLYGGELTTIPLGDSAQARFDGPFWTLHRADLQSALADLARATPGIALELNADLRAADRHADGVTVHIDVAGNSRSIEAAGLIGADGVHSAVRTRVLGGPAARYAGKLAYRAVAPIDETPHDLRRHAGLWLAPHAHLVHYPVRSGREINIVAIFDGGWSDESWSAPALRDDVMRQFSPVSGTHWPEMARALIAAPDAWTKWALRAVDPRFGWTDGAVAVMGDAAHAMLPFAAQGACMAIEDAAVLAERLGETADIPAALAAYERQRKERCTAVADLGARNGRAYHLGTALGTLRDLALRAAGGRRILERQAWVYDWRVT